MKSGPGQREHAIKRIIRGIRRFRGNQEEYEWTKLDDDDSNYTNTEARHAFLLNKLSSQR